MQRLLISLTVICFLLSGCKSKVQNKPVRPSCLKAHVTTSDDGISITNMSNEEWTHLQVQIDQTETSEGFQAGVSMLQPSQTVLITPGELIREDGLRFDPQRYAIDYVAFTTVQGDYNQVSCDREFRRSYIERLKGKTP